MTIEKSAFHHFKDRPIFDSNFLAFINKNKNEINSQKNNTTFTYF